MIQIFNILKVQEFAFEQTIKIVNASILKKAEIGTEIYITVNFDTEKELEIFRELFDKGLI